VRDLLLRALDDSLSGWKKQAALTLWPKATEQEAGSRLSRVLSGELNLPPGLLQIALQGANPGPLREYLEMLFRQDSELVRERMLGLLDRMAGELEAIRVEIEREREAPRRQPVRVRMRRQEIQRAG